MQVDQNLEMNQKISRPTRGRRVLGILLASFSWLLVAIGAVLIGAAAWIERTFGAISVDQMLLNSPGVGNREPTGAEFGYISSFVWQALVLPLGLVVILALAIFALRKLIGRRAEQMPDRSGSQGAVKKGRRIARVLRARYWLPTVAAIGVLALGSQMFASTIGLAQYVRSATTSLSMSDYYAAPVVERRPEQAQNLVLIYLESMENAFSDESMFEENMLAPLERATTGWDKIDSLRQYDGGGWTMAGIVGTQCGVPLRGIQTAKSGQLDVIGADADAYLPGAVCLGDVLADEGYTNVFMGGADAAFASKRLFLTTHGYDEVLDLNTWRERGDTEFSDWGLSDRALMANAKSEIDRLHASGQPFNLTMLTLDTHEPAHAFDYCPVTTEIPMASITRCSMEQVSDFINYMNAQGYLARIRRWSGWVRPESSDMSRAPLSA